MVGYFGSHECMWYIRKIKYASWNIYHWKRGIFEKQKSISLLFIREKNRQTCIDQQNGIMNGQAHFALGAISGLQNTLTAISFSMKSNKNKLSIMPFSKFQKKTWECPRPLPPNSLSASCPVSRTVYPHGTDQETEAQGTSVTRNNSRRGLLTLIQVVFQYFSILGLVKLNLKTLFQRGKYSENSW